MKERQRFWVLVLFWGWVRLGFFFLVATIAERQILKEDAAGMHYKGFWVRF